MVHEPQTLARTQRGRRPPHSDVLEKAPGRYRIEYSVFTRKDPHHFEADHDVEALKYVARHLGIPYPFSVREFRSTGARRVYCESQHDPIFM